MSLPLPILVTLVGITIDLSEPHPENTSLSIIVILEGILTEERLLQDEKAPLPVLLLLLPLI